MKPCSVTECNRPHKGRGLCDMHLQRLRRTGTTNSPIRSQEERFWAKVDKSGGCWEWTGAKNDHGYGVMRPTGERTGPTLKAHRFSAELAGMNIEGRFVLHSCDNPPCVNPAHLRPGEHAANMDDMSARGRSSKGSHRPLAKLTESDVARIHERLADGDLHRQIAADYGVARSTITRIASGKHWKHVTPPAARDLIAACAESLGTAA